MTLDQDTWADLPHFFVPDHVDHTKLQATDLRIKVSGRTIQRERPSPKGEGFVLRLKPLIVGHAADAQAQTTRKLSSGDSGFWSSIYFFQTSSVTFPLLATQYPRAHKC